MATETIKDFLVSLGFQTNSAQQRKFTEAIEGATLRAKLLGDAMEATARKIGATVASASEDFERLFYQSRRMGASAAEVKAFSYAISQWGGSQEAAAQSLEIMGQKLRENRGNIIFLQKLGFEQDKLTGQLKFNAELAAKGVGSMSNELGELYRQQAGLDEQTYLTIRNNARELARSMDDYKRAAAAIGFDPQKASEDAVAFNQVWRDLFMRLKLLGDAFYDDMMVDLQGPLQELDKFIMAHQGEIADALKSFTTAFGEVTAESVKAFEAWSSSGHAQEDIKDFFKSAAEDAKALADAIKYVVDSIKYLADLNESSKQWTIMKLLNGAANPGHPTYVGPSENSEIHSSLSDLGSRLSGGKINVDGTAVSSSNPMPVTLGQNDQLNSEWASGAGGGGDTRNIWQRIAPKWLGGRDAPGGGGSGGSPTSGAGAGVSPTGNVSGAMSGRARQLMDRLIKVHGWTPEAAAIAAGNAQKESGIRSDGPPGDGGISHGMFQWNKERFSALQQFAAGRKTDWRDFDTQVDFLAAEAAKKVPKWPIQKSLDNAGAIGRIFEGYGDNSTGARVSYANHWLNAFNGGSLQSHRLGGDVSNDNSNSTTNHVNQSVQVHVDGSRDPEATGNAVAAYINRTNADIARNFKGAAQ